MGSWQRAISGSMLALASTILHTIPWLVETTPWFSWLAMALGLYLVCRQDWLASGWATWLWSSLAIAGAFHWSPGAMAYSLNSSYSLGLVVALPLVAWDGLRMAAGYWLAARISRDQRMIWLPAALIFILFECAIPTVFPWRMGFMQLGWTWLVQPVDLFGGAWTTLIAFAHAGLILAGFEYLRQWPSSRVDRAGHLSLHPATGLALGFVIFNFAYGAWSLSHWQNRVAVAPKIRFGLVQVDPSFTDSLAKSRELTEKLSASADIIVWPESSGGNYELTLEDLCDRDRVFENSREPERGLQPWPAASCELLLGGKNYLGDRESPELIHVTAMMLNTDQTITGRYHKRFLMPFGEYVPGEDTVPGMAQLFDMAEHIQPGSGAVTIDSKTGARVGAMLCYEDMMPQASADMTQKNANVLISLINGSAFESTFTLQQHRLLSQLRSIECRKYFLRCAATGETCVISPTGEILDRLPLQTTGSLLASIALLEGDTFFTRYPWLSPLLCSCALLGLCVTSRIPRWSWVVRGGN